MSRAAIDIGTNSMRLLVVGPDGSDIIRLQRVTGLGRGVDADRRLAEESIARTIEVLAEYGRIADRHHARRRAVATSATRDADNREEFLDRAESALGVRPEVISGEEEARLAFVGATSGLVGDFIVVDIGGGSTEFVYETDRIRAVSVDIGSVRLTDRLLADRPARFEQLEAATEHVGAMFDAIDVPAGRQVIGVAGTWTSLAAIEAGGSDRLHGSTLDRRSVDRLVGRLGSSSLEETAALPGLDPARAPVILAGAVIARQAMQRIGTDEVRVSERDLLDGVVAAL